MSFISTLCPEFASAKEKAPLPVQELCPRVTLVGKLQPGLSTTEKKLVCGDPDQGAWKTLPFAQAKFNLKNFLQSRGYYHPVFMLDEGREAGGFRVEVGEPTLVHSLEARNAPEDFKLRRKRRVIGEIMTPALLGTVEQWAAQRLGAIGYPCPKVTTDANPDTGDVVITVEPGPRQNLVSVTEEPVPGVTEGMMRRYDAFNLGELYDGDLLAVTQNRITQLNVLQATYFTSSCGKDGAVVHQQVTAGPPRLLTFGLGLDTEGVFQGRVTWRNARMGNHASFALATAQLSTKDQEINVYFDWYPLPFESRRFFQPFYSLQHQNQNAYEIIDTRVGLQLGTTYDRQGLGGFSLYAGPVVELARTLQGSGSLNPNDEFLQFETTARLQSHDFEYWATDPRKGYEVTVVADFAGQGLGSTATAQRFNLSWAALFNARNYDPPLVIFGLRGGVRTTFSPEQPGLNSNLPANFFWYLGGSTDLRGFSLQSVPSLGAKTAFFLDPELRLADSPLPLGIQPFVFFDLGAIGQNSMNFDSPILYSPGVGLRWKIPVVGLLLRTTLARGYPVSANGGWNFYLSLGEEF